jgi:Glyoxalase-like domain
VTTPRLIDQVDHLVYATPDVDAACAELERRLGVRATVGGQHRGRGTRNALISIGPQSYLEIIGPDAAQPAPAAPRWFGVDALTSPRLVAWAAHGTNLERLVEDAQRNGVHLGAVSDGRRERPDGVVLTWEVTDPSLSLDDVVVPFFIDWGMSPHPSSTAVPGPRLVDLRGEHPDPESAREMLRAVGITMAVSAAAKPSIVATFQTESGLVELR